MKITILGTESLGVRGLACEVVTDHRRIVIDPGVALGFRRHGLLPHPVQIAVGIKVRRAIKEALARATDVVISHYHGDHIPLPDANPYQLSIDEVVPLIQSPRFWAKGPEDISTAMEERRTLLIQRLDRNLYNAENQRVGPLSFSRPVPHGQPHTGLGKVMMTRVKEHSQTFVHASDIQLLNREAVNLILEWQPDIALVDGPSLYLSKLSLELRKRAWKNAQRLAAEIPTLILDHHLLRDGEGLEWLSRLSMQSDHQVICAADFMNQPRRLLEAQREQLYSQIPIPEGWHTSYARGDARISMDQSFEYVETIG